MNRTLAAAVVSISAVLGVTACEGPPTYCEQVAVVYGGSDADSQLAAMSALAEMTDGQESRDWRALRQYVEESGAADSSPDSSVDTSQVDAVIDRLEGRVDDACGEPAQG